jgi:hypothetical protein
MELTKPEGIRHLKDISLSECRIVGNRLYFRDRLYVPDTELRLLLLQLAHDSVEIGHPGKNKLYDVLSRDYWWPLLSADCGQFTRNCHDVTGTLPLGSNTRALLSLSPSLHNVGNISLLTLLVPSSLLMASILLW